jgi:hypothetical protein
MALGRPTTIRLEAKVAGKPSQAKPCGIDVFLFEIGVPVPKDAK